MHREEGCVYTVGDYIVHPGQGVCLVDEITSGPSECYLLLPVGQRHPMRISFPVASEDRLRPVLSESEARAVIEVYPSLELDTFTAKSNALEEEHFRNEIRQGTCPDTVRIVKTFRAHIAQIRANNKKPPVAYERILKHATERSLTELSVALDTTVDDVRGRFMSEDQDGSGTC